MGCHVFCTLETSFSSVVTASVLSKNPAIPSAALNQATALGLSSIVYSDSAKGLGTDVNIGLHVSWKSKPCFPASFSTEETAQRPCFV